MGRKYNKPPIVEALCEFCFEPGLEWDITFPGLFYEKVRHNFPKKRTSRRIEFKKVPEAKEAQVRQEITTFIQFLREDEKALVQITENLLVVNFLKPYPSWHQFYPEILDNLKKYIDLAKPKGVRRVGLRYINRIEFETERVKLEDYFNFYPHLSKNLPESHGYFIAGIHVLYEDGRDMLRMQLSTAESDRADMLPILLDLDYFLNKPGEIGFDQIGQWLEVAHSHVEDTFEACITDKLRQMFEEEA